ncbi:metal ABC transporter ATP-binding protein [Modestobacter versicolor]|uniref:Metal ABC transporter ATP-binding protein n=1 Tax=Modestobacter versicolor TaxID=429133 RepID=A0A323V5P1_9ACTN|nr:metal ABC transporter ATP-binding protein [Modestobacter versicolor]
MGLTVRRGEVLALDGVSARLPAGAVTALVGGNGAGKSTLLDVLAGVLEPTSGRVDRPAGTTVAYVPQRSAVPDDLPVTVGDTLAMGRWRELGRWRRLRATDHALVAECADRLGLTGVLGVPLSAVSGGQRQRALVAQGLVARAGLLLVDEPTAGVDAATQAVVLAALAEEAARGAVVVHATHERAAVDRADRVLTLVAGRVDGDRTTASLPAG